MKLAMPEKKRKPFHSTIDWDEFKELLMLEYGSIQEFERAVQQQFAHLSQFSTRKEVAEILSHRFKELINTLDCVGKYHDKSIVENLVLSNNLNQIIIKCLPSEFIITYSDKIGEYHAMDPKNLQPRNTFYFNAEFIKKIETGFKANPIDFDHTSSPMNVNVNAVHYRNPQPANYNHANPNPRSFPKPSPPRSNFNSSSSKAPLRPCSLDIKVSTAFINPEQAMRRKQAELGGNHQNPRHHSVLSHMWMRSCYRQSM